MRRELIAAVSALALMTGAAYAQDAEPKAGMDTTAQPQIMDNQAADTDLKVDDTADTEMNADTEMDSDAAVSDPAPATGDAAMSTDSTVTTGPDMATVEKMLGADVIGADGEDLGEVEDVILDSSGKATQLVIASGGFLGIGEKEVAVDFADASWNEAEEQVQLSGLTQDQIGDMAEFEYSDTTTSLNRRMEQDAAPATPATPAAPAAPAIAD